jgi:hypothetical protein
VLRDVDQAEPVEVVAVDRASGQRGLLREGPQDEVQRDEDRELREKRQARGSRVDAVLLVELHQLLLLLPLVGLVLLLDLLHLRRVPLEVLHRVDLLDRERDEDHPDDHRQRDDRPGPGQADRAMDPVEDVPEEVLERAEDAGDRPEAHA